MRVLLAAVLLVVAGCGTTVRASTPSGAPSADLTATDLAFAELVIPQNESALAALALTATRPGSTLRPVTDQVAATYRDELARVRDVLARAGRPETRQHDGHDMPGMITAAELAAIGTAEDTAFDEHLRTVLRTQFEEARTVARAELSAGTSKPVLDLGAHIERTRTEFLTLLGAP
ncbi:DUF305 domain-containing protein [Lentzea sp. E54]|uniref:DUF305 domain-containing protein n=1 Tax=Lentzea xerophila TaxID=3435883 RepID=UPI003DA39075